MEARIQRHGDPFFTRKSFIVPIGLCLFSLSLQAQQAPLVAPEKLSIEGLVVKAATSEPLNKAWLTLRKLDGREPVHITSTDARGRFVLRDLEPGQYRLWVERKGYVRQEYGQRAANRPGTILTLAPGQHLRDVVLRLIRTGAISGRVYDEDGEPTVGVRVLALRYAYVRGHRQFLQAAAAMSNDLGEYRLYGLAPGRYYISATYKPGPSRAGVAGAGAAHAPDSISEEGYAPTYYPGTNSANQAAALELGAGEDSQGIDFTLFPTRTVHVRGRVISALTGRSVPGTNIWLAPRESALDGFRSQTIVRGSQGIFELDGVTPGSYLLRAKGFQDGKVYAARYPLDVGNFDLDGINLSMVSAVELRGRVQVEGNSQFRFAGVRVLFEPREDTEIGTASASVKSDGTFVLKNVAGDVYDISLTGIPEDFYLKAARYGSDDVLEGGFDFSRSQVGPLELLVSSRGGRIDGTVRKEQKAIVGTVVVLVPDPPHRGQAYLYKTTSTDQYGQFTLRGVASGNYKLFAWEEVEAGAYQDPFFLGQYEKHGESLRVVEGGRYTVQLELIPYAFGFR